MTTVKETAWMVTNPETHSGAVFKATTAEGAAAKAVRHRMLKGVKVVEVRSFAGQDRISRQTFVMG